MNPAVTRKLQTCSRPAKPKPTWRANLRPTQRARSCTTALVSLRQRFRARADASSGHAVWPAMRSGENTRAHATTLAVSYSVTLPKKSDNVTIRDIRHVPSRISPPFGFFLFTEPCCFEWQPEISPVSRSFFALGPTRSSSHNVKRPGVHRLSSLRTTTAELISHSHSRRIRRTQPTLPRSRPTPPRLRHAILYVDARRQTRANPPGVCGLTPGRSYPQHIHRVSTRHES